MLSLGFDYSFPVLDVATAFMLFPTLQDFLPYTNMDEKLEKLISCLFTNNYFNFLSITIGSVILSAQIISNSTEYDTEFALINNHPVELNFTINVSKTIIENSF